MRRGMKGRGGPRAGGERWKAAYDPRFKRQYAKLDGKMAERAGRVIEDLLASDNVRDARDYKGRIDVDGAPAHAYACRVGRSYRILYCVVGDCIRFLQIGDHKEVYGRG